jgi:hypothetical protein
MNGGISYAYFAILFGFLAMLMQQNAAISAVQKSLQNLKEPSSPNEDKILSIQGSSKNRGMYLGADVTGDSLYRAYKIIQKEYMTKAFESKNWIEINSKDGIIISMLKHPSDPECPYVKMTSIMPVSPEECWSFLSLSNWETTMPHMDPFYEGVSVFQTYQHRGVTMTLARKRTKRLLAFGKRDFFFISVADIPRSDGTLVSGTVSVIAPNIAPRQTGYTRAFQDSIAFYEPLDSGIRTRLTIVCRIDLNDSSPDGEGGYMPMWLYVKTIGVTAARSVLSMRNFLEKETMRRISKKEGKQKMLRRVLTLLSRIVQRGK